MDVKGRGKKQQYSKIPFFVKRKEMCTFYAKWNIKGTLVHAVQHNLRISMAFQKKSQHVRIGNVFWKIANFRVVFRI